MSIPTSENCKTVKPIEIDKNRKLTDEAIEKELTSFRSVVGSLAWVARYDRPAQRACSAKAREGSDLQITFKSDWIDWEDLAIVTFSNASFANSQDALDQLWIDDLETCLSSNFASRIIRAPDGR